MKKLFFIRHAKADRGSFDMSDMERPLNERGERDAPSMGKKLHERGVRFDLIYSSPAVRARTTALLVAREVGYTASDIVIDGDLYEATLEEVLAVVHGTNNACERVAVFGHNPTCTDLANYFNRGRFIENVPTCGIVELETEAGDWSQLNSLNTRLVSLDFPKKYKDC